MAARLRGEAAGVSEARQFFAGDHFVSLTQPRFCAVTQEDRTKYFHVRSACCRYYLAPTGSLCATCPLLDDLPRRERNLDCVNRYEWAPGIRPDGQWERSARRSWLASRTHPAELRGATFSHECPPRRIVSLNLAADECCSRSPDRTAALTYLADDPSFSNVTQEAKSVGPRVTANAERVIAFDSNLIVSRVTRAECLKSLPQAQ
jgi:hypothetical protein